MALYVEKIPFEILFPKTMAVPSKTLPRFILLNIFGTSLIHIYSGLQYS